MKPKVIIAIILLVLAIIVFFQNMEVVDFHLFFWTIPLPRIIWLLITLIIGLVAGYVLGASRRKTPWEYSDRQTGRV